MRHLFISLVILSFSNALLAQNSTSLIKIIDENSHEGVADINIELKNDSVSISGITDSSGCFYLRDEKLAIDTFKVVASKFGYTFFEKELIINTLNIFIYVINPDFSIPLQEVVIEDEKPIIGIIGGCRRSGVMYIEQSNSWFGTSGGIQMTNGAPPTTLNILGIRD